MDTSSDWSRQVLAGVIEYLRHHEFWHIFVQHRGASEHLALPPGWQGNGVIARITDEKMVRSLHARGHPVVNVSAIQVKGAEAFPRVTWDAAGTARLAVEYFLDRGFRHFAYLSILGLEYVARQHDAYVAAVNGAGYECFSHSVAAATGTQSLNWNLRIESLARWLLSLPKPVALLTWSGTGMLINACHAVGLQVPEEVAVLRATDDFLCNASPIPISAVRGSCEQIGREAAALLDRLMRGGTAPKMVTLIPPLSVVTRQSTDTMAVSDAAIVKALSFIRNNSGNPVRVSDVAAHSGLSRRLLERRFIAILGRTPAAQIRRAHLDRAKTLLAETTLSVEDIAQAAGFGSPEYMTCCFRARMKITPLKFRLRTQRGGD